MLASRLIVLVLFFQIFFTSISQTPKRIVSLVPSITKQLFELGVKDNVIGCTSYCPGKDRKEVTVVASAIKVNVEKVLLLKPDLVLASSLTSPKTLETFKKLGVKIVWFDYPKSYNDLCNQFLELSKTIGKENKAQQIINKANSELKEIEMNIVAVKPVTMLLQIGANPLWVAIENTFMNDYIKFAKAINVAKGVGNGAVSRESILVKNPDIIFIFISGEQAKIEKRIWLSYKSLNATQNNRIFIIDSNLVNSPTPSSFITALDEILNLAYTY